jgi:uncharacterized protein YndB with AHSA1/START domain
MPETTITADPNVPAVVIERAFAATPAQLFRAHTDPELVVQWLGPDSIEMNVDVWDCRAGGEYRYHHSRGDETYRFRGCYHTVRPSELIVQTFSFEGMPDDIALETLRFAERGDGTTVLHATSLVATFEGRDMWLRGGMESGVTQGYAKLDALLSRC